MTYLSLTLHR